MGTAFAVAAARAGTALPRRRGGCSWRRSCGWAATSSSAPGALIGSFLVASAVLARIGEASLGAHQIAFQLFVFLALVLDAIAIAGQVLVGADARRRRRRPRVRAPRAG